MTKPRGTIKRFEVKWKSVLFPPLFLPWVSPRPIRTDGCDDRGRLRPPGVSLPISTRIKVYREFDVQNRMEGTAGFFTVSLPLAIDASAAAAGAKPIRVKF